MNSAESYFYLHATLGGLIVAIPCFAFGLWLGWRTWRKYKDLAMDLWEQNEEFAERRDKLSAKCDSVERHLSS